MIERAFKKQTPKLVLFETDAIYRTVSESKAALTRLGNRFPIFRYHNRWKNLSRNDLKGKAVFTWTNDYKGYVYNKTVDACPNKDYMTPVKTAAKIPDLNLQYVREIKDYCEANGAKMIFLSTPSPVNWNYERHNGIETLAKELACEYKDLNLMNDEVRIDWEKDTRDKGDHLNHSGAKKVTHYLADYLMHTGLLEDHRTDSGYEEWNTALKKYEAAEAV